MSNSANLIAALDYVRIDAIAEFANLTSSYWRSIQEAAQRGERLTVEAHCKQVSAVTRESFGVVKTLGIGPNKASEAA
jgi:hypothetical protein